jgi:hypothetical protein
MALVTCQDCGRQISGLAVACPSCGRPNRGNRAIWYRDWRSNLFAIKVALGLVGTGFVIALLTPSTYTSEAAPAASTTSESTAAAPLTSPPAPAEALPTRASRQNDDYQSLIANVWVGNKLYLKSDHAYIGVIRDIESDHIFPDGTQRDGILVQFASGDIDWVPRKTAQLIYLTKP